MHERLIPFRDAVWGVHYKKEESFCMRRFGLDAILGVSGYFLSISGLFWLGRVIFLRCFWLFPGLEF